MDKGQNSTDLREYLLNRLRIAPGDVEFTLSDSSSSSSLFSIQNDHELGLVKSNAVSSREYQVPVLACTTRSSLSTLCDQAVFVINVTTTRTSSGSDSTSKKSNLVDQDDQASSFNSSSLEAFARNVGFAYQYGAYTIQQFIPGRLLDKSIAGIALKIKFSLV